MRQLRNWNYRTIIGISIVIFIVLLQINFFSPVRDRLRRVIVYPATVFDRISLKLSTTTRLIFSINDLAKENDQLRLQNSIIEAELAKLSEIKTENDTLRSDLNFQHLRTDLKLTPAEVITFSPSGQYQVFVINRGSRDGLEVNQAVVSNGFLIGKISKVDNSTAEVQLITNPNLLTPIILTGSQTIGILSGGIRGLVVENIPLDTSVSVGESVVTSALEGIYPSGIAIGKVEEIISKKEDIFISLRISSPVKFGNLSVIFVVTK